MDIKRVDIGINLMNKQFDKDREKIVENSLNNGTGLIITGTDLKSSKEAIEFIRRNEYKNVWCTCGIHPHNANEFDTDYMFELTKLLNRNTDIVVAVGEIGLDYDRMFSSKEDQKRTFKEMLNLGISDKALFLHERKAVDDFIAIMKTRRKLCKNSIVHCFTGDKNTVYRYLQMGFTIGITGWICDDRRNKDLIEAVKIIPTDRLLVETDATYLTPLGHNLPRRNTPDNLKYIIDKIADIKKIDNIELEKQILKNTISIFNLEI